MSIDTFIDSAGTGAWFGLTAPLAIHVGIIVLERLRKAPSPSAIIVSRIIRFVICPLAMFGIFGLGSAMGVRCHANGDLVAYGLFGALALYLFTTFLYKRAIRDQ